MLYFSKKKISGKCLLQKCAVLKCQLTILVSLTKNKTKRGTLEFLCAEKRKKIHTDALLLLARCEHLQNNASFLLFRSLSKVDYDYKEYVGLRMRIFVRDTTYDLIDWMYVWSYMQTVSQCKYSGMNDK